MPRSDLATSRRGVWAAAAGADIAWVQGHRSDHGACQQRRHDRDPLRGRL